jgi:hypothetical protein
MAVVEFLLAAVVTGFDDIWLVSNEKEGEAGGFCGAAVCGVPSLAAAEFGFWEAIRLRLEGSLSWLSFFKIVAAELSAIDFEGCTASLASHVVLRLSTGVCVLLGSSV